MKSLLFTLGFCGSFFVFWFFFLFLIPGFFCSRVQDSIDFQVKEIQFKIVKLKRVVIARVLRPLTESVDRAVPRHRNEVGGLVPPALPLSPTLSLIFASLFPVLTSFLPLMASLGSGAVPGLPYPILMSLVKERLLSPLFNISESREGLVAQPGSCAHPLNQSFLPGRWGAVLDPVTTLGWELGALNLTDSSKPHRRVGLGGKSASQKEEGCS